jgi:hypothetical protein
MIVRLLDVRRVYQYAPVVHIERAVLAASEPSENMATLDAWTQRPHYSRGRVLLKHRTLFRTLGLHYPVPQQLGHGSFGAAYAVPIIGGSVIKLTRDPYESIASFDLAGKKTKYTVPIYGVWTVEDSFFGHDDDADDLTPWYVVHRAYLQPLDKPIAEAMNLLYWIYHDDSLDMKIPQPHHRGMRSKWEAEIRAKIDEKNLNPKLFPRAMLLLDHVGVAIRELHDIGIDWFDFHASNMMRDREGTIRIADVGWGVMHQDTTREIPYLTEENVAKHLTSFTAS